MSIYFFAENKMPNGDSFPTYKEWLELDHEVKEWRIYETLYQSRKNTGWKRIMGWGALGGILVSVILQSPILLKIMGIFF